MKYETLISDAIIARRKAYVPYSNFSVGAALLSSDGNVYSGCNIENASYSATVCAERTAFYHAMKCGDKDFEAIAIVGGIQTESAKTFITPCGVCRQVMSEFCSQDFKIVCAKTEQSYKVFALRELFPSGFDSSMII